MVIVAVEVVAKQHPFPAKNEKFIRKCGLQKLNGILQERGGTCERKNEGVRERKNVRVVDRDSFGTDECSINLEAVVVIKTAAAMKL